MRDIGKNIKTLRQKQNITQEELAEKLFVTRQTVSNYEIGRTRPDIDMLMKIAEILEADMNELLYGPTETVSRTRQIVKTCIGAGCLATLLFLYLSVSNWATIQKHNYYNMTPTWLLAVGFLPVILLVAGWVMLQILGLAAKLQPLSKKPRRVVLICALVWIGGYILAVIPLLLADVFSVEAMAGWPLTVSFYVLGYYPRHPLPELYLMLFFLAGGMLWLAGVGNRRASL